MRRDLSFICLLVAVFFFSSAQAQQTDSSENRIPPVSTAEDKVFEKIEVEATVNLKAWQQHLMANLMPYINDAASKGMKAGTYIVYVRFIVEKDGSISDVKALNDVGYGLAPGAIKVVRTGPKWKPGEQNGQKVRSYHTQPIGFAITEK